MKVAVIGAGAIGGLVAGYLKDKGLDICLVGRKGSVEKIKREGLRIKGVRQDLKVNIEAGESLWVEADLAVFAVKMPDLATAAEENLKYLKNAIVVSTQNGIGAEEILARFFPQERILSSIVLFGATLLAEGEILHNFEGRWVLGKAFNIPQEQLQRVAQAFAKAFTVEVVEDIEARKWLKVFLNANNCIPALLNQSIQACFADLELSEIAIGIWQEGLGAIKKADIELKDLGDFPAERIYKLTSLRRQEAARIYAQMMLNLSKEPLYGSILQSIRRHKPSEIDYINGAFVKLGRAHSYHTPLNKKIVELVHRVERERRFFTQEELIGKLKNLLPREDAQETINTVFPRLRLTVIKVEGDCYHGYKEGDQLILEDFTHPPKHFCLGLAHVLFPVIYALSFGARFPFSENQRSLEVTCPDGGKLSFKVEIFDREGKIEEVRKDPGYKGPQPQEMVLEVVKSKGGCSYGYKVGDKFVVRGLRCPQDFCGAAYHCAFPALFALNFGARFFFMDDPEGIDTVTCPDGGKIVFKVYRKR